MNVAVTLIRGTIRLYQWLLSPVLAGSCRYTPTCSAYAEQAVTRFGPVKGLWLALRRLSRCHPWAESGWDPVPEAQTQRHVQTTARRSG